MSNEIQESTQVMHFFFSMFTKEDLWYGSCFDKSLTVDHTLKKKLSHPHQEGGISLHS